jgi:hypothetical protein
MPGMDKFEATNFLNDNKEELALILKGKIPIYLGYGVGQTAWSISNDSVLKVYHEDYIHDGYSGSLKIWKKNLPWSKHEPRIHSIGRAKEFSWVSMEKFILSPFKDSSDEDSELWCLSTAVEDYLDSMGLDQKEIELFDDEDYFDLKLAISSFILEEDLSSYSKCITNTAIKLGVSSSWINDFIFEVGYKSTTMRSGDLHPQNFGFRMSTKQPVFFDW